MTNRFAIAAVATFMLGVACRDATSPTDELSAAKQRWGAWGSSTYDLVVSRVCFCPVEAVGPVNVTVQSGTVTSRRYSEGGATVDPQYAGAYPDVLGLFEVISQAIQAGRLGKVEYDAISGYPRSVLLDFDGPSVTGADGEVVINASLVEMASSPPLRR